MGAAVWFAVIGVAMLVVVGMVVLGERGEPRVPRRSPVSRALERRARASGEDGAQ